ncbi:MAG: AmmeMemoRadiSam system protein B, partial [Candidatus Diapherotrites archaeon]|nr:AmmeMemoRadiSam system protein B [Candidatus Diapherotrites archaeon]
IGPNHSKGNGHIVSSTATQWLTPLGPANVNESLSKYLVKNFDIILEGEIQHSKEHSIEVQLPFLQYCFKNFNFVPLMINDQSIETSIKLAEILHEISKDLDINIQVIASSDFSHYVPKQIAEKQDLEAINYLLEFETNKFFDYILENNVTVCGFGPIIAACEFAKLNGAKKAKLLKYSTSAQVTQDESSVVGYASLGFY